jgi:hypothetical protein
VGGWGYVVGRGERGECEGEGDGECIREVRGW